MVDHHQMVTSHFLHLDPAAPPSPDKLLRCSLSGQQWCPPFNRALPACIWPSRHSAVAEVEQLRAHCHGDAPPPQSELKGCSGGRRGTSLSPAVLNGQINNKSLV